MRIIFSLILIIVLLFAAGCTGAAKNPITVEDAWARATNMTTMGNQTQEQADMSSGDMQQMSGGNSAVYMVIFNSGSEMDRLLKASSDSAKSTEIHVSEEKDGVMSMHPVESVDIPAKGKAELTPGGYHIMLVGIKKNLAAGDKVLVTLDFEKAGEVQVEAEVRAP